MPQLRQPLFLARATYRKRRLRDGARLLPIFGLLMLLVPLLWPATARAVAPHWAFVFAVWAGLIVLAGVLSRRLVEAEGLGEQAGGAAPDTTLDPIGDVASAEGDDRL